MVSGLPCQLCPPLAAFEVQPNLPASSATPVPTELQGQLQSRFWSLRGCPELRRCLATAGPWLRLSTDPANARRLSRRLLQEMLE